MSTSKTLLRWVCVVPAGLIGTALVMFPIHWAVMATLGGWGIDPVIHIQDRNTLKTIELMLQAAFGPLAFVYLASLTAPSHRKAISVLLSFIIVLGLPTIAWFLNSRESGVRIDHGFFKTLANVLGTGAAILWIRSNEKEELSSSPLVSESKDSAEVDHR